MGKLNPNQKPSILYYFQGEFRIEIGHFVVHPVGVSRKTSTLQQKNLGSADASKCSTISLINKRASCSARINAPLIYKNE